MSEIRPDKPTFARLVLGKALTDTKPWFRSRVFDTALATVPFIVAFFAWYLVRGRGEAVIETLVGIVALFGSFTLMVLGVFVWNLWLAPAALAYEAVRGAAANRDTARSPQLARPIIYWSAWKQMDQYTLEEFSALLARCDPAAGANTNAEFTFLKLMKQDIDNGTLQLKKRVSEGGYFSYRSIVARDVALEWAKARDFDVSHIT